MDKFLLPFKAIVLGCLQFRHLFAKTVFALAFAFAAITALSACKLEAPKASKGNSGGQTTSRPGDTPSVGDAGGSGKVMSTPEEVKEEIEKAWKFFQQGGIGPDARITTFHNILYTLMVLKKTIQPNAFSEQGWTTDSLTEEYLRENLHKDVLLKNFVTQLSNEEELLRHMMTRMHDLANEVDPEGAREDQKKDKWIPRGWKFAEHHPSQAPQDSPRLFRLLKSYLAASELSFEMSDCAPDFSHKVAAVSAHSKGAKVCFNLAKLENVPKYLLHQELHGYILHEFLHLIGYKEDEVAKIHTLYNITMGFSQEVSHILAVQKLANGLRQLASAVLREAVRLSKVDPSDEGFSQADQFDLIMNADKSRSIVGGIKEMMVLLFEYSKHREIKRLEVGELMDLNSLLDGAHLSCSQGQKSCSIEDFQRASALVAAKLFDMQIKVLSLSLPESLIENVSSSRPLYINAAESVAEGVDLQKLLEGEHVQDTFEIATGRSPLGFGSIRIPRSGEDGEIEFERDSFDFSRMKFITRTIYDTSLGLFLDEAEYQKVLKEQEEMNVTSVFYESVFKGSYRDIYYSCVVDSRLDF